MKNKTENWVVKIERPEEIYGNPELYYTEDEIEKYALLGSMKKTQEKLACRILELLEIKSGKLLDLGCGVGYTTQFYQNEGFEVIGIDILEKMLDKARAKSIKVVHGNMKNLPLLFKEKEFDAVVSASALQWLKDAEEIKKVASGVYYVLKDRGKIVIQFYPKSQDEMIRTARIFKKVGFEGQLVIDSPENPRKRVIYLVMGK